jgi:hypothetical protein
MTATPRQTQQHSPVATNTVNFTVGPATERANSYHNSIQIDLTGSQYRSTINTRRSNMLAAQAASLNSTNAVNKSSTASLASNVNNKSSATTKTSTKPNFVANSTNTSNAAHLLLNNSANLLHSTQSVPGMANFVAMTSSGSSATSPNTLRRSTRSTGNGLVSGATGNVIISTGAGNNVYSSGTSAKRYK